MRIHSARDDIYVQSASDRPYVSRGLTIFPDKGWEPDAVERIKAGKATPEDFLKHIDPHDAGNFWFSVHSPEEAKAENQYSLSPEGEHPADMDEPEDRNQHGNVWGQVGVNLVGHRPAMSPEHDRDLDEYNRITPAANIKLHQIHYDKGDGSTATLDLHGQHSVNTAGPESGYEYQMAHEWGKE